MAFALYGSMKRFTSKSNMTMAVTGLMVLLSGHVALENAEAVSRAKGSSSSQFSRKPLAHSRGTVVVRRASKNNSFSSVQKLKAYLSISRIKQNPLIEKIGKELKKTKPSAFEKARLVEDSGRFQVAFTRWTPLLKIESRRKKAALFLFISANGDLNIQFLPKVGDKKFFPKMGEKLGAKEMLKYGLKEADIVSAMKSQSLTLERQNQDSKSNVPVFSEVRTSKAFF